MKKLYFLLFTLLISIVSFGQDLIITGTYDGPNSGGTPKGIEIYVVNDIADLSTYGVGSANNGGGSDGVEFTFPADAVTAGSFIYVSTEETEFTSFFGFTPNYTTSAMGINGDDAVELFSDVDTTPVVIDVFGDINTDGTGEVWDHVDGWAYRVDGTGPEGSTFTPLNWTYSGTNQLEGGSTNATCDVPFPIGTYSTTASATPTINAGGTLNFFYFENNGPSDEESTSVSGINLADDIVVTASTNFQVSLTSGGPYTNTVTLSENAGTVDPTPVYVIMVDGLLEGMYMGDLTATSLGATDATVTLDGTVGADDPLINTSGSIFGIEYTVGTMPSSADSFGVSALFLVDDLVIDAPTNFEVALDELGPYSAQVSITPDGNGEVMSTDIWVRLVSGLAVGNYTGDVNISSTGATPRTEAASGDVNPAANCPNPGDLFVTEIMQNPSFVGDNEGEYFEVYNNTASPVDMVGFVISDNGSNSHTIGSSLIVPANGYAVLGINSDSGTNGGITIDYEYSNFSLANGDDEVIITCSGTVIDMVEYDGGPNFPDPTGASMELSSTLFDLRLDNLDNNVGTNWGPATIAISGTNTDLGTPGGANSFALSTDNFDRNSFSIYPNPTNTGEVTISTLNSTPINVVVYDILGKRVQSETISNNILNVSNLRSGIYLLRLEQNGATTTKKLVIE